MFLSFNKTFACIYKKDIEFGSDEVPLKGFTYK